MKRLFLLSVFLLTLLVGTSPSLRGAPIDTSVAKRVAGHFFQNKMNAPAEPELVYVAMGIGTVKGQVPMLYIYNVADNFVILSGDDRVKPVLGYSTESAFDPANIPDALQEWLEETRQQISGVMSSGTAPVPANLAQWESLYQTAPTQNRSVVIGPLLSTQWDQNAYYNNLCPADSLGPNGHVYAGCVATMMAQVIRYWQYPTTGMGSRSYYLTKYGWQNVDYSAAQYNYVIMPDKLTASTPTNMVNETAKLIYHCAVSVKMQFNYNASGASLEDVNGALQNYFGYASGQYVYRDNNTTDAAWIATMKSELDLLHPIMYRGAGSQGGHAFVCDGYDSDNLFHFNWGWNGAYNGYYNVNNLNPYAYVFSTQHAMLIGIQAATPILIVDQESLFFQTPSGVESHAQPVQVHTHLITDSIQITSSGSFLVGSDTVNMSHYAKISPAGQTFYVRYNPVWSDHVVMENAQIAIQADALSDTIALSGIAFACPLPQTLTLTQVMDTVMLQWTAPSSPSNTYTISKDSSNTVFGFSMGNLPLEAIQRFLPSDLSSYHLKALTQVSFIPLSGIDSCAVRVYMGGSLVDNALDPGTLVLHQPVNVSDLNMGVWNTIDLDSTVIVDATQEMWIGVLYKCQAGQLSFPFSTSGDTIQYENNIVGLHVSSTKTLWYTYNYPAGVMKATIEDLPVSVVSHVVQRDHLPIAEVLGSGYHDAPVLSGHYVYDVITNWDNGCMVVATDSIDVVVSTVSLDTAVCSNAFPLVWHGVTFMGADTQYVVVSNQILVLHVAVNPTVLTDINDTICSTSLPYLWHSHALTQSGSYTDTLDTVHGCDSIVTLHLTVLPGTHNAVNVEECEQYTWHVTTYTASGTYTHDYTNAQGCPSTDTLHLTIHPKVFTDLTDTVCSSSLPYLWHSHALTQSGSCTDTLATVHGCDSIVTLHLTVLPGTHNAVTVEECEQYTWHGTTYTASGTYTHDYTNAQGCPSTDTLHLTIFPKAFKDLNDTICSSELPYLWHSHALTQSGSCTDTLATVHGCDSIVTLHLTVNPTAVTYDTLLLSVHDLPYEIEDVQVVVASDSLETMEFQYLLETMEGCDSLVYLYVHLVDVGVDDPQPITLKIYPVPASSVLYIEHEDLESILIYDMNGRLLKMIECHGTALQQVQVTDLADGVYLLSVRLKDGSMSRKLFNIINQ